MRTCAKCGVSEDNCKKIHTHHKNGNRNDNRCENLIYLCATCHSQYHNGHWDYINEGLVSSHISEKDAVVCLEDRHLVIPETIYLKLEDMAADLRKKEDSPFVKSLITPKSTAQHILAVATERHKRGHYAGKVKP